MPKPKQRVRVRLRKDKNGRYYIRNNGRKYYFKQGNINVQVRNVINNTRRRAARSRRPGAKSSRHFDDATYAALPLIAIAQASLDNKRKDVEQNKEIKQELAA